MGQGKLPEPDPGERGADTRCIPADQAVGDKYRRAALLGLRRAAVRCDPPNRVSCGLGRSARHPVRLRAQPADRQADCRADSAADLCR
ncbi:hypothetical protein D3C75_1098840 [compost metagenome]